jgi:hypothetical protein
MDETDAIVLTAMIATLGLCIVVPPLGLILFVTLVIGSLFDKR